MLVFMFYPGFDPLFDILHIIKYVTHRHSFVLQNENIKTGGLLRDKLLKGEGSQEIMNQPPEN